MSMIPRVSPSSFFFWLHGLGFGLIADFYSHGRFPASGRSRNITSGVDNDAVDAPI